MKLISKITQPCMKYVTKVKANSPTVLVIGGTICLVGAVVAAHEAGRKVEITKVANREAIDNLKDIKESGEYTNEEGEIIEFTEDDYKKELTHAYLGYFWDMTKLYGPVVLMAGASAGCYIGGHKVLAKRLAGMTAAYTTIDQAYKRYRENVIKISGEDADKRYFLGLDGTDKEKWYETAIDEKTGDVKQVGKAKTRDIDVVSDVKLWKQASPYAVRLDMCKGFTKDSNYNVMWLQSMEKIANDKLDFKGYLTLYEVYDALGVVSELSSEVEKMSHQVGWVKGYGDGDIRFNLVLVPSRVMVKDGALKNINEIGLIDFNCVGTIWDKI